MTQGITKIKSDKQPSIYFQKRHQPNQIVLHNGIIASQISCWTSLAAKQKIISISTLIHPPPPLGVERGAYYMLFLTPPTEFLSAQIVILFSHPRMKLIITSQILVAGCIILS